VRNIFTLFVLVGFMGCSHWTEPKLIRVEVADNMGECRYSKYMFTTNHSPKCYCMYTTRADLGSEMHYLPVDACKCRGHSVVWQLREK